jgi:glycosyltransferase involved in cell wall biosynthesis
MKPKIALFYDWLNQWGGAEKVLLDLIKIYPEAPIYTLIHDQKKTNWLPKKTKVITSFVNKLPFAKNNPFFYTPLYSIALEQFDFSNFDIVISTSSTIGHCLLTQPNSIFICYFHNVNRHIYQQKYFWPINKIISNYKKTDYIFSKRPDFLFCNSRTVQERIKNIYKRKAKIIYPGINTSFFTPSFTKTTEKYFLTVSRLVAHKKVELAIQACHQLKQKLYIVGTGRNKNKLQKLIKSIKDPNIKFEFPFFHSSPSQISCYIFSERIGIISFRC